ncbi:MAG TPA: hypothetical protein VKB78_10620 [Pirellulales bacterium]|nr:hypothetical protein [Pirellulales bacterium]
MLVGDGPCAGFLSASSGDGGGGGTRGAASSGEGCDGTGFTRASGESLGSLKMIDFELDMITVRADASIMGVAVGLAAEPAFEFADGPRRFGSIEIFGALPVGKRTAADFEPGKTVFGDSVLTAGVDGALEKPGSRPPARTYTNPLPNKTAPATTPAFTASRVWFISHLASDFNRADGYQL